MKGRKPKPTGLKLLTGNPGKRPLNAREPAADGAPRCPHHLTGPARQKWAAMVRDLRAANIVTRLDGDALALYCVLWARWVAAEKDVRERGEVLTSDEGGQYQNPYLAIANRALRELGRLAGEFGLTPSSRSRVKVVERKGAQQSAFDRFLAGGKGG